MVEIGGQVPAAGPGWGAPDAVGPGGAGEGVPLVGRHRLHRFPARTRTVRVRYGDDELVVVQRAAAEAGLRPAGYVAVSALAAATGGRALAGGSSDRQVLAELLQLRLAVCQYGVSLNQVAAAVHSGGQAQEWLGQAVAGGERVLASVDEAARRLARRLS